MSPWSDPKAYRNHSVEAVKGLPSQCRVLVTPTSYGRNDPQLKTLLESSVHEVIYNPFDRPLRAAELMKLVKEIDGYIAGLDEIDESVIRTAPRLRVIARYGVGVDRVDLQAATRRKIAVTNTPGANAVAVSELTVAFMLALARQLCVINEITRRGGWPRAEGLGLFGKNIGLLGFGAVGKEVAARIRGFGCHLLAYDPLVQTSLGREWGVEIIPLDELLSRSDFVSLHVPLSSATQGLVDRRFIGKMKPGAYLINTARGELVDETALAEAIRRGHLRGAALDCFRQEPPEIAHPLFSLPQVIVTAHIGAHTDEAMNRMGWMALEDCLAVLRGEKPRFLVNPEVYSLTPDERPIGNEK
jgi:D-3-phosphoglycerate dehydrogenase